MAAELVRSDRPIDIYARVSQLKHNENLEPSTDGQVSVSHLDILADLKRIHSHICSVAYPVLEAAGELPALETSTRGDQATDALGIQPKLP